MKSYNKFLNEKVSKDEIKLKLLDFVNNTKSDWNYITPEELKDEDLSKYYLLDIRNEDDFKQGHIKGAKNIYWMNLLKDDNLEKLPKNKKIVLICYVGHTASQMLVALKLLNYDVISLKFGMGKSPVEGIPVAGWLDFGYEIIKD